MAYTDEAKRRFIERMDMCYSLDELADMLSETMGQRDALQKRLDEIAELISVEYINTIPPMSIITAYKIAASEEIEE